MKFKYYGFKPETDGGSFNFRTDSVLHSPEDVILRMNFKPELPVGYELLGIPEYTPPGWMFKYILEDEMGLSAIYEPITDFLDPRDSRPDQAALRVCVIKTVKQEYVEDER